MEIRPLDASDEGAFAPWYATYLAADTFGRDHATPWALEEVRANLLGEQTGEEFRPFGGYVDDQVVACGTLMLHLLDNVHVATALGYTHPDHRNRGYGAAMLAHLAEQARAAGRTILTAEAAVPYEGPADGAGHPYADFLTRRGFGFDLGNVVRVLDLPADVGRVQRLADEAAPYHADYTLRRFVGPVPDDILLPFGELVGSLMAEAPSGELEVEKEVFDEQRIRQDEEVFEASGRRKYTTVAVAPDGELVAYSEVVVPRYDPDHVFQWGTLVLPAHRGHRLGMATKAHNLLWVQAEEPSRSSLVTTNAEVNAHMVAVNDALGFRPVERLAEFTRPLSD